MKKILILGGTGFIGKSLTNVLEKDYHIVAYGKDIPADMISSENVEYISGDLATENGYDELLMDVDVVVHLACSAVPSDDTTGIEREINENLIPTIRLLETLKGKPETRLVFASSAGTVYGETGEVVNTISSPTEPNCSYGVQKVVLEDYIKFYGRRYGLNYAIMRMSNPYGLGQDPSKVQGLIPILIRQIMNGKPVTVFGDGENLRDYIYLPELIKGIVKVIEYTGPERIFNLGLGKYYSINEVIMEIERVTGKKFISRDYIPERFCDVKKSLVDFGESHRELEWYPKVDLEQGVGLTYRQMICVNK